ncbi:1396_t:CDS:1 [Racocetra persica]|uniref:1396_t:CDS:1 n=1 Tax=Racocetra persica TaxID=160502 RepID=A0ACA9NRW6_9GLOM|nr:1396_t:CDS:1 [Racocetra persica]
MPKTLSRPKKRHPPSTHNINIHELVTSINVPFPPKITIKDLLAKVTSHDNKPGRTPNAFISYKMVLHRALKSQGCNYPISVISKIASLKWNYYEPNHVKSHYVKLADEAKQDHKKSGPFFIMAPDCKSKKETNPKKEIFEVESDSCNASIHLNNGEQGSYSDQPFEQQTMDFLNGFSAFSAPSVLNESSTFLNESSEFLDESSASLNEHSTFLDESSAPLTPISNDFLQNPNLYWAYFINNGCFYIYPYPFYIIDNTCDPN